MFVSLILEPCSRRGLDEELRGAGGLRGYKCWRFCSCVEERTCRFPLPHRASPENQIISSCSLPWQTLS